MFIVVWDAVVAQGARDGIDPLASALKSTPVRNLPSCPYARKEWMLPSLQCSSIWRGTANAPLLPTVSQFPIGRDSGTNKRSALIFIFACGISVICKGGWLVLPKD